MIITIHRFQPKTGKHRNQTWELSDGTGDYNAGSSLPEMMSMAFGEITDMVHDDVIARTHAIVRIAFDAAHGTVDIWTAPTTIRPYTEKVLKTCQRPGCDAVRSRGSQYCGQHTAEMLQAPIPTTTPGYRTPLFDCNGPVNNPPKSIEIKPSGKFPVVQWSEDDDIGI